MIEPTEMELRVADCLSVHLQTSRTLCLKAARTAIRAMREPTLDMIKAGDSGWATSYSHWQAMIDAASPPEATPE